MVDTEKYIEEAMQLYLRELPENSETAQAIREDASLAQVSQIAEREGLHYISAAIFMAEEERFVASESPDISDVIEARVGEIRRHLPQGCATSMAIDRGDSWSVISQCAQEDGLSEIASLIFEAEQEGLED